MQLAACRRGGNGNPPGGGADRREDLLGKFRRARRQRPDHVTGREALGFPPRSQTALSSDVTPGSMQRHKRTCGDDVDASSTRNTGLEFRSRGAGMEKGRVSRLVAVGTYLFVCLRRHVGVMEVYSISWFHILNCSHPMFMKVVDRIDVAG